jgi:hypothetical protein
MDDPRRGALRTRRVAASLDSRARTVAAVIDVATHMAEK